MATRLKQGQPDDVLYLYGVTMAPAGAIPHVIGVDGSAELESIVYAGFVCWVSRVPKAEFADNLARNMENLDWLAEASVRHQRVVSAVAQHQDMLPTRFGTIFLSESTLKADIDARKKSLESNLKRIAGCDEWGIKVFRSRPRVGPSRTAKSGRDYLQAKSELLRARESKGSKAEIEPLAAALKEVAQDIAYGGAISGGQPGLQWQGSVLLKRGARKKLESIIKKFSQQWEGLLRIECSGPWPPYSFVSRSDKPAAASEAR
jgi:hypothetical protein